MRFSYPVIQKVVWKIKRNEHNIILNVNVNWFNLFFCNLFLFDFSTIRGKIDQVNQVLTLEQENTCGQRYDALDNWTHQLSSLHQTIVNKMA